jgi:cell envelope opacity-associated protein A
MITLARNFKLMIKDLVSLAAQLEGFNSVIKNQLSFNKMVETQVAQLASSCPNHNSGKLPGQPEVNLKENVNTRGLESPRRIHLIRRMQVHGGKS